MVASTIYRYGVDRIRTIVDDMRAWLDEHEYESVAQLRGSMSQARCPDPTAYERVNYMKTLASFTPHRPV
jgi:dihydroorotate dehydrogenase (fumarate)